MPLVSVVTVFHNRAALVEESMASLLAQTWQRLEIIAVDDGSRDDTRARLEALQDSRLRVVSHPNQGFTRSIARAVALSKGELVAVHGSGDISLPERIARQAAMLAGDPGLGVVGCHYEMHDPQRGKSVVARRDVPRDARAALVEGNPFSHGEVMFRRSVYEAVGGYRPFFTLAQDRDLWLRMARHTGFGTVPEVLYRRSRIAGGVAKSPVLQSRQMLFSDFAVHCARQAEATGRDPLDEKGPAAALLYRPSREVARRLLRYGAVAAKRGDLEGARAFLAASRQARDGLMGRLLATTVRLAERRLVPRPLVRTAAAMVRACIG